MAKKSKKAIVKPLQVQIYESMNEKDKQYFSMYLTATELAQQLFIKLSDEGKAKAKNFFLFLQRAQKEQVKQETKLSIDEVDKLPDPETKN